MTALSLWGQYVNASSRIDMQILAGTWQESSLPWVSHISTKTCGDGHVVVDSEEGWGGLFVGSSGCQNDHSHLLQEWVYYWQNSWSQKILFSQHLKQTVGDVITITHLRFFLKEKTHQKCIFYVPGRDHRALWGSTPPLGRLLLETSTETDLWELSFTWLKKQKRKYKTKSSVQMEWET